jgi:hypothetical protein
MKTINRIPKRVSKFIFFFLLLLTSMIFTTCIDDDEYKIYYYDVYGEGYVYYRDTNLPIKNLAIQLKTGLYGGYTAELFINNPVETIFTDSKGYYRIHFIKKAYGKYPVEYYFSAFLSEIMPELPDSLWWSSTGGPDEIIPLKMVDNAKTTIKFDTMKYYWESKYKSKKIN